MNITSRHTTLSLALAVGAGFLLQPFDASAIRFVTTGSASCKPTNAARATAFAVTNFYIQNTSTLNEYLVCSMPQWHLGYTVNTIRTDVFFGGTPGGTVLCTAQSGYSFGGVSVAQSSTITLVVGAGTTGGTMTFPALLRNGPYYTVAFTCRIPPGFKLGLIEHYDPDPPSGYGWVP